MRASRMLQNGRRLRATRAWLLALLVTGVSAAEERWWVSPGTAEPVRLPADIADSSAVQLDLEYASDEEPEFLGAARDLNRDGAMDWVLRSHASLCGTGGCTFLVIDGATRQPKGKELFGFLVRETGAFIDGWPVLEACSRSGRAVLDYAVYAVLESGYARIAHTTRQISESGAHSLRCDQPGTIPHQRE